MIERDFTPDEDEIGWLGMRHPAFATVSGRLRQLGFNDEVDAVKALRLYAIQLHREVKALEPRCGLRAKIPAVLQMVDRCIVLRDKLKRTKTSRLQAGSRDHDVADCVRDEIGVELNALFSLAFSCDDDELLAAVERLAASLRESQAVVKKLRALERLVREAVQNG